MLRREARHLGRRVLGIGRVVVGHDERDADPGLLQRRDVAAELIGDRLHIRTMVADEGDDQTVGPPRLVARDDAALRVRERKVRRERPDLRGGGLEQCHGAILLGGLTEGGTIAIGTRIANNHPLSPCERTC